jgi:hypothetical protein
VIALEVTVLDVAAAAVFWVTVLVALWRWPGAVIGIVPALALWTVAPLASWLSLVVVGIASPAWRVWRRGVRPARESLQWLLHRPAVMVVSAGVSALAPEPLAPVAFAVLVVSTAAVRASWPQESAADSDRQSVTGASAGRILGSGGPNPYGRVAGGLGHVVAWVACVRCGGVLVATVRLPADSSPADLAGTVARAGCSTCGARLVGLGTRHTQGRAWCGSRCRRVRRGRTSREGSPDGHPEGP